MQGFSTGCLLVEMNVLDPMSPPMIGVTGEKVHLAVTSATQPGDRSGQPPTVPSAPLKRTQTPDVEAGSFVALGAKLALTAR